jgi:hypothetical protein
MRALRTRPTNVRPCPLLLMHPEALMSSCYVDAATRASRCTSLLFPLACQTRAPYLQHNLDKNNYPDGTRIDNPRG